MKISVLTGRFSHARPAPIARGGAKFRLVLC
jgi:hypothetical protein